MVIVETPNALFGKHVVCILCSRTCCDISGSDVSSALWYHVIWYGSNQTFGEHSTFVTATINQQMRLYNFHLKHLKPLRHVSNFWDHQGVSSFLAKVITYSQFSSFLWTMCCGSITVNKLYFLSIMSKLFTDMLPQHLFYKNGLNCEYVITLARNDEIPWWRSEKIETCRSGFKCFKWKLYRCIWWLIFEVILRNAPCNDEIHSTFVFSVDTSCSKAGVKPCFLCISWLSQFVENGNYVRQIRSRIMFTPNFKYIRWC